MPSTIEFAAKRRKKKTRNCTKGYNCGNSCINKGLKCRRKFSNQASTYADWLKKNATKTVENSKNTRKKLTKLVDDASSLSHSDRRSKLDKLSKDKAVELIVKHTVDGQMDSELRTGVAELIDRSKKEVIKDVGVEVTATVERAGMTPTTKRKRDGKTIIDPEYRNLTDDLAKEVLANQSKFVKGERSPSGKLKKINLTPAEERAKINQGLKSFDSPEIAQIALNDVKRFRVASNDSDTSKAVSSFKKANTDAIKSINKFQGTTQAEANTAAQKLRNKIDRTQDKLRAYDLTSRERDIVNDIATETYKYVRERLSRKATSNLQAEQDNFILNQAKKIEQKIKNQPIGRQSTVTSSDRNILRQAKEINKRSRNFSESNIAKGDTVFYK